MHTPRVKPIYYKRYVDDTFLVFIDVDHIPLFLQYLNSKHENIKFTYEIANNVSLPFLDVLGSRLDNHLTISVYRKPTFTSLGTNYLSFISRIFKINAVKTLLHRCYVISFDWFVFHKEINYLTNFFMNNGYPYCISKFLYQTYQQPTQVEKGTICYLKLPYYSHLSYIIHKQLDKLLKNHFSNVQFKFVFSNPYTIKSFFPFKDRITSLLRSNVVRISNFNVLHVSVGILVKCA